MKNLDGRERLNRALDRLVELDRNYDPTSGARLDGVGLDGGHKIAHGEDESMSAKRENMQMENKYVNRVKGKESGDKAVSRFKNSLLKRLKSDAITPEQLANSYQFSDPVIGSERLESPGEQ